MLAGGIKGDVRIDGALTDRGYIPVDWLLDDLDRIYEMLSGELVPLSEKYASEDYRPDDELIVEMLKHMDENDAREAFELGWNTGGWGHRYSGTSFFFYAAVGLGAVCIGYKFCLQRH